MKRPDIYREKTKVILECFDEQSAKNVEYGINKAFKNPLIRHAISKPAKKLIK